MRYKKAMMEFYVISMGLISNIDVKIVNCKVFEVKTDSFIDIQEQLLIQHVENGLARLVNADVVNKEIRMHDWINRLEYGKARRIFAGEINENKYKLVAYYGQVYYVTKDELKSAIDREEVANCGVEGSKYVSADTVEIKEDIETKNNVCREYNKFISKSKLVGRDLEFEYVIEGKNVKITKYIGRCKDIVVPKFVTSIASWAFSNGSTENIKLTEGLKYIGANAFYRYKTQEIIIPETVEFMGRESFDSDMYTEKRLRLLSKNTLII